MRQEIIFPIHTLQNMKQNLGSPYILKSYHGFCIGMFFAHICYVLQELARTDVYLKRTLTPLLMAVRNMLTRYQNAWENVPNMMTKKNWRFFVAKCQNARKHARMRVCEIFYEMLKMA